MRDASELCAARLHVSGGAPRGVGCGGAARGRGPARRLSSRGDRPDGADGATRRRRSARGERADHQREMRERM